jgi:hypothetical protein
MDSAEPPRPTGQLAPAEDAQVRPGCSHRVWHRHSSPISIAPLAYDYVWSPCRNVWWDQGCPTAVLSLGPAQQSKTSINQSRSSCQVFGYPNLLLCGAGSAGGVRRAPCTPHAAAPQATRRLAGGREDSRVEAKRCCAAASTWQLLRAAGQRSGGGYLSLLHAPARTKRTSQNRDGCNCTSRSTINLISTHSGRRSCFSAVHAPLHVLMLAP